MAEITAATAIEWVVSPVISLVINKTQTFIEKKYFEKSGIEDDMNKMNTTLEEILLIMGIAEKQRIVEPNQMKLVRKIKDAVYDAEDCMDEFDYNLLKEKSEEQQKKDRCAATSCSGVIQRAIIGNDNDNFNKKVKDVIESLNRAKRSAETLLDLINTRNSSNIPFARQENQPHTSSIISEEIIGRQNERELLIDFLFEKVEGPPTIIPIVGQGGIGKTTLAQMVFNDPRVKGHFDQIMWLTISDNFDKFELTKQMLKYVSLNFSTKDAPFDLLQKNLETELALKKILVMLDDVWYVKDDNKKYSYEKGWLEILAPLKKAKDGSKIIMTTREDLVVSSLASFGSVRKISLDGLNDDDSWLLFKLKAFDDRNLDNLRDLEPIGKKIVNVLKGFALAIRLVGTELRGKSDIEEWKRVLNDNSLDKGDILEILRKSYEHLPEHLQCCFAYCSLFPKGYYLKRNRLVHMWIAQRFVHPLDGNISEKEKNGQSYFNELIARSFIQVIKRGNKEYYVMHDLMNDLACHVSKDECYILKQGDNIKSLGSIRHLSVTPGATDITNNILGLDKLRTLIFLYGTKFDKNLKHILVKLKRIRVLDIEYWLESLPNLAECKYLHYLCFRYNKYSKFAPDFFSMLHHLTVLFIRKHGKGHTDGIVTLPRSIWSISSLELIDVSKSLKVDIAENVKLRSLLRGGSILLHVNKKKGRPLGLLRDFNNIKGSLDIFGLENVDSREEVIQARISSKKHVTELRLFWFDSSSEGKSNKHREVLEALLPNPSTIEWLGIYGYLGNVCPSWLESNLLTRIKLIVLEVCHGLEMLPALGKLPLLKTLCIGSMNIVRRIGDEFYGNGTFPSLEEIVIGKMRSLEEWSFPCGVQTFPKLYKLAIFDCPRFAIPEWDGFPALQELQIWRCDAVTINAALKEYGWIPTLTIVEIVECKGIITLDDLHELVTLKYITIKTCPNLVSLTEMEFFYSLKEMKIYNCPKLRSLPKKGLPVSLRELNIGATHHDLEEQIRSMNGPEWDKIAAISGCRCLISSDDHFWDVIKNGRS